MHNAPTLLTFPLGDLTVAVRALQAYLVLDRFSASSLGHNSTGPGAHFILYRGTLVPLLDLANIFGLRADPAARSQLLVLEHEGELAALRVPPLRVAAAGSECQVSAVNDRLQGLPRLLIAEDLHTPHGVWHMLDVAMSVRIANQASQLAEPNEPAALLR